MLKTLVSHFTTNPSGCVRSVAAIDLFGMRQSEMFSWVFGRVRCAVQQTFLIPISLQSIRQTKEPGSLCQLVVEELATLHPLRCLSLATAIDTDVDMALPHLSQMMLEMTLARVQSLRLECEQAKSDPLAGNLVNH